MALGTADVITSRIPGLPQALSQNPAMSLTPVEMADRNIPSITLTGTALMATKLSVFITHLLFSTRSDPFDPTDGTTKTKNILNFHLMLNEDEAIASARMKMKERFPTAVVIQANAMLIPDDFILDAAAEIAE